MEIDNKIRFKDNSFSIDTKDHQVKIQKLENKLLTKI